MHSSTSNSSAGHAARGIRIFLGMVLVLGLALEVGLRVIAPRIFGGQKRILSDQRAVAKLNKNVTPEQVTVLFLGNSFTEDDLDLARMQEKLGAQFRVVRVSYRATTSLDWYFCLKKIFREGVRPDKVVIGGRPGNFTENRLQGPHVAFTALHRADIFAAGSRVHANPTVLSDMFIAHGSMFYGWREEINKRVLTGLVPKYEELTKAFRAVPASSAPPPESGVPAIERLTELKSLCASHGAELIVWLAPHLENEKVFDSFREAAKSAEVALLIPLRDSDMPPNTFHEDKNHLNKAGAIVFTDALAPQLRPLLTRQIAGPAKPVSQKD